MDNSEYSKKTIEVNKKKVEVFEKTFGEFGNITVEAGTNGFRGSEHANNRTYFKIEKTGSPYYSPVISTTAINNGFGGFSLVCYGDEGLRDCIEALEFALNVLKNQSSYDSE